MKCRGGGGGGGGGGGVRPTYNLAPLEFWPNFDFTLMIISKKTVRKLYI